MTSKNRKLWQISAILFSQVLALATMIYAGSLGVGSLPDTGVAQAATAAVSADSAEGECTVADTDSKDAARRSGRSGSGLGLDLSIANPLG